ncbi:MAG: protein translocase subunit SecF [Patescibacteria group bacterium]
MAKIDLIKNRYYFYGFSLALLFGGIILLFAFPMKFGIDLTGGNVLEVKVNKDLIQSFVSDLKIPETEIFSSNDSVIIKGKNIDKSAILSKIKEKDSTAEIERFENISPSLSGELRKKALMAIILVLLAIGFYVAYAFRKKSGKINGMLLGIVVILSLFHDVVSSFGLFAVFSKYLNLELNILAITAFLVIAGFSVHDTIVVFDRLRENIGKTGLLNKEIFNKSVNETIARSINTSFTAILSIIPLIFLLPHLHSFLLPLIFGIVIGTYSSIFIAVPLVYDFIRNRDGL